MRLSPPPEVIGYYAGDIAAAILLSFPTSSLLNPTVERILSSWKSDEHRGRCRIGFSIWAMLAEVDELLPSEQADDLLAQRVVDRPPEQATLLWSRFRSRLNAGGTLRSQMRNLQLPVSESRYLQLVQPDGLEGSIYPDDSSDFYGDTVSWVTNLGEQYWLNCNQVNSVFWKRQQALFVVADHAWQSRS